MSSCCGGRSRFRCSSAVPLTVEAQHSLHVSWNCNFSESNRWNANCSDIPTQFTAGLFSLGFLNQKHLRQQSLSVICSRPFQLWPCEHGLQTPWHNTLQCLAAASFLVLNDPTVPDFREESLIRAPWSYIPVAGSDGSQNQANESVTLGNVALSR